MTRPMDTISTQSERTELVILNKKKNRVIIRYINCKRNTLFLKVSLNVYYQFTIFFYLTYKRSIIDLEYIFDIEF